MRVAEREIDGVKRAEATAVGDHAGVIVLVPHQRQHFMPQIIFVLLMPAQPILRLIPKAVETFLIDAVHAVELQMAPFDFLAQSGCQAEIFVFVKPRASRWKHQHLSPGMTEHQQFHIAPKMRAIPLVIFPIHPRNPSTD